MDDTMFDAFMYLPNIFEVKRCWRTALWNDVFGLIVQERESVNLLMHYLEEGVFQEEKQQEGARDGSEGSIFTPSPHFISGQEGVEN